jgi:hypothetical protein
MNEARPSSLLSSEWDYGVISARTLPLCYVPVHLNHRSLVRANVLRPPSEQPQEILIHLISTYPSLSH